MNVMIHACPPRLWYVNEFLAPSLRAQGIEPEIYVDTEGRGNLGAFLHSVSGLQGSGGTWHLQDDVLVCRDFAERTAALDRGVVNGFCSRYSKDNLAAAGEVYPPDLWMGFPCVRIPDDMAREFTEWIKAGPHTSWQDIMIHQNSGDDFLFHHFFEERHPYETAYNAAPNLVEHVDWLIGGSVVNEWREFVCRSDLWTDEALVDELKQALQSR